jgi:SAM-dependent methyltransferase
LTRCSAKSPSGPLPDSSGRREGPPEDLGRLRRIYRGYAEDPRKRRKWAADNPGNEAIRAELLAAVEELTEDRLGGEVLDVGCGGGWLLEALSRGGVEPSRLHGVEALAERAAAASRRVPGAQVQVADARRLPYESDRFELVTLIVVVSSMRDHCAVAAALREARRIASPTGVVLCYEPRLANPLNRATRLISRRELERGLGPITAQRLLTGLPPLARRLGPAAPRLYPLLSRLAPTHRLTAHAGSAAPR